MFENITARTNRMITAFIYLFIYSVAYKLVPNVIEFYETIGQKIADRLMFVNDGVTWESKHIAA